MAGKEYERQLIEDYDNDLFSRSELSESKVELETVNVLKIAQDR